MTSSTAARTFAERSAGGVDAGRDVLHGGRSGGQREDLEAAHDGATDATG